MDEPTNDLDLETLDILRDTLLSYQGTLIVISHDRDFSIQLLQAFGPLIQIIYFGSMSGDTVIGFDNGPATIQREQNQLSRKALPLGQSRQAKRNSHFMKNVNMRR